MFIVNYSLTNCAMSLFNYGFNSDEYNKYLIGEFDFLFLY